MGTKHRWQFSIRGVAAAVIVLAAAVPAAASGTASGTSSGSGSGSGVHAPAGPLPAPVTALVNTATHALAPAPAAAPPATSAGTALVGVFSVTSGSCSGSTVSGSYFRMIQPGGNATSGPFISNGSSTCSGAQTYTPLSAGTEGLSTQAFEPFGSNPAAADAITQPAQFFGSAFADATETPDHQSGASVPLPSIQTSASGQLSGQVTAFQAYYNSAYYNQGAPKPSGAAGITSAGVSGTYNASTGAYTLNWVSTIEGGSFNGFSGSWHLTGVFHPSSSAVSSSPPPSSGAGSGSSSGSSSGSTGSTSSAPSTTGGAAPSATGTLAFTGPAIPFGVPGVLALLGLTGWAASRRLGRPLRGARRRA